VLLDAELLPWSAKAGDLIRSQYAAVGAAARAAVPAAVQVLQQAAARGLDVAPLLELQEQRASDAVLFTDAYRRYCWPTDGLSGVALAPFQVLASAGQTFHTREHAWHLAVADRLCEADPELVRTTAHRYVDVTDPASEAAATRGGRSMTEAGGEGMVVKPAANVTKGRTGRRAARAEGPRPEYLRIIYGPDYTRSDTSNGCASATSGASAAWPSASTPSAWRRSTAQPGASRCGACTSASSPCWRWSPSRSTRGCEDRRLGGRGAARTRAVTVVVRPHSAPSARAPDIRERPAPDQCRAPDAPGTHVGADETGRALVVERRAPATQLASMKEPHPASWARTRLPVRLSSRPGHRKPDAAWTAAFSSSAVAAQVTPRRRPNAAPRARCSGGTGGPRARRRRR
jgi:hypothetical protein